MKIWIYIFTILLMACGNPPKKKEADQNKPKGEEWLVFGQGKDNKAHLVLISGDEEYRSEEALPQLAKILSEHHGFKCTVLFAQDPEAPGVIDANHQGNIPGLESLEEADLMVIFTRFRKLPDHQMKYIDNYLKAGKPVIGIRTATHAFSFENDSTSAYHHYSNGYEGNEEAWTGGFGRLVLGEKWISHHGKHKHQSTLGILAEGAQNHPITNGIEDGDIWGATDVYGVRLPLPGDARPIVLGQVMDREGEFMEDDIFYGMKESDSRLAVENSEGLKLNDPKMPIAWTKSYQLPGAKKGMAFTSTIGSSSDLLIEGTRRLLVNGVYWILDLEVPEKANVDLVGDYQPTRFEFRDDAYWQNTQLKVTDMK